MEDLCLGGGCHLAKARLKPVITEMDTGRKEISLGDNGIPARVGVGIQASKPF